MIKSLIVLGIIGFLCLGINIGKSRADGGIYVPHDFSGYETGQRAFIYFNNQIETLVVSANFSGDAKDFSWVIPVPTKPEINKSSTNLFKNLEQITEKAVPIGSFGSGLTGVGATQKSSSVQVVEQKEVGVYDTEILKATDENALGNYLKTHGYNFPSNQSKELKSYVDDGWYFAIAKIQPDLTANSGADFALRVGTLTPLKLTFSADKIIYPMKLTGVALRSALPSASATASAGVVATVPPDAISDTVSLDMPIDLYILSSAKVQNKALQTDYANWPSASNLENLNETLGNNQIPSDQKLFLTKLSATIAADKIADDFTLTTALDNQVVPAGVDSSLNFWLQNLLFLIVVPIMLIFFPAPIGLIFLVFVLLQKFVKRKWLYIIGLIYEIFACFLLLVTGLYILLTNLFDLRSLFLESGAIGIAVSLVALIVFGVYVTIRMIKRYRNLYPHK